MGHPMIVLVMIGRTCVVLLSAERRGRRRGAAFSQWLICVPMSQEDAACELVALLDSKIG
jgi:hypothetical protein